MLTYTYLVEPTPNQINEITLLYRLESWWSKESDDPEMVAQIISGSHCFMIVTKDNETIGG
jgi:hypothetical protein